MTIPTPVEFWTLNNTRVGSVGAAVLDSVDTLEHFAAGKIGQAWGIDAVDNSMPYLTRLSYPAGNPAGGSQTWSLWVRGMRSNPKSTNHLFYSQAASGSIALLGSSSSIRCLVQTGALYSQAMFILADWLIDQTWHHVVGVASVSGGQTIAKVWVDGVQGIDGAAAAIVTFDETPDLRFGNNAVMSKAERFWGLIDAVGFWNQELSPTQIAELYNAGAGWEYEATSPSSDPVLRGKLFLLISHVNGVELQTPKQIQLLEFDQ